MRRLMALMCVPAIIVLLVACGSSSTTKSSTKAKTSPTTEKPSSTTATPATGATTVDVKTFTSPTLGKILVTNAGKTVYTLTDNGVVIECTDANGCSAAWPPVLLAVGATKATGGEGVTGLGITPAAGGQQVMVDGHPVYTFSGDTAEHDAKGEGITSFGGTWHVVKAAGASSSGSSTTTTSGSSGGY